MIFIQHELIEDVIRRRQQAMHAADQQAPAFAPRRLQALENDVHTAAVIAGITLAEERNFALLVDVIEQLTSEVAGARDAVEHERALRRLI